MSEYAYRANLDLAPMVDRIAAQIQHKIDQAALDKIADTLEQYGYVKVVRCRDCKHFHPMEGTALSCRLPHPQYGHLVQWQFAEPDGYCWRGKRKEGGDDR